MDRLTAFNTAKDLVDPIIEQHGLNDFRTGPPFGQQTSFTKVDQHVDHIIRIADWLRED